MSIMIATDLHTHTTYCDGKNTPAEMAAAAYARGFSRFGMSGHSYVAFDTCCMSKENTELYRAEVQRLKKEYEGRMEILLGVEQDFYSEMPTEGYDYVIGSVHYLKVTDPDTGEACYPAIDDTEEILKAACEKYFAGVMLSVAEAYYETVAQVAEKTNCDIIGHVDLITKYIEKDPLFDTGDPRYVAAWKKAVDRLLTCGKPFEVNVGAIARGYRTTPYPAPEIIAYIKERGGKLVLSSDSHSAENVGFEFEKWGEMI